MKKLLFFSMMCLMAMTMQAQKCAVLGFEAGAKLSLSDIDGISETFSTYFQPAGYTMVERSQIDKVISEQRFQLSKYTQEQMVRLGEILNVSKVVIGKIYITRDGGYQVDVRVVDAQTGVRVAADGATVRGDFRQAIKKLAQDLASKIAIRPGSTVQPRPSAPATTSRTRSKVEVLYGYLKIFPNELGTFQSEPTSVIAQINKQAQHGYNNWRIPTNEELSLMRANNYLGSGEYMCRESKHGIVLLVTDGEDYATIKAEEQEKEQARIRAVQERKAAQERRAAELKAKGLVDLGLPSGTLWKDKNEEGGFYTYEQAKSKYGDKLPTIDQFEELKNKCQWSWNGSGYKVIGPNGNSIVLPASGYRGCGGYVSLVGSRGYYWSSTPDGSDKAWDLYFGSGGVYMGSDYRCSGSSVRLVQD
jgi:hypothetical protein